MNQTANLATFDRPSPLDCPVVGPFYREQAATTRLRVLPLLLAMKPSDTVLMLRRLLYLLDVTTGIVVIAGCQTGSIPRVAHSLMAMRAALRDLKGIPIAPGVTADHESLTVLATETGRLFAVCMEVVNLRENNGSEEVLDLCVGIFETVAAID